MQRVKGSFIQRHKGLANLGIGFGKNAVQFLESPLGSLAIVGATSAVGNPELAPPIIAGIQLQKQMGVSNRLYKMHHVH